MVQKFAPSRLTKYRIYTSHSFLVSLRKRTPLACALSCKKMPITKRPHFSRCRLEMSTLGYVVHLVLRTVLGLLSLERVERPFGAPSKFTPPACSVWGDRKRMVNIEYQTIKKYVMLLWSFFGTQVLQAASASPGPRDCNADIRTLFSPNHVGPCYHTSSAASGG